MIKFKVKKGIFIKSAPHIRLVVWNPDVKTDYRADPKRVRRILKEQKS